MTFSQLNRRVHLYMGMFLLPWFFVYGVSSLPFSHAPYFQALYNDGVPQWSLRFDRRYDLDVLPDAPLRHVGARIMKDAGLEGAFGASRPDERQISLYVYTFWTATRVTYFIDQRRLLK